MKKTEKLDLTIAILTWKAPVTLQNTLESYKKSGLLDLAKQKLIFIQEDGEKEKKIAKKYGLEIFSAQKNIGISNAFNKLLEQAKCGHFLFLENDWLNVEDKETTFKRLKNAIDFLDESKADCIRLRHRNKYGEPLHSIQFKDRELDSKNCLLDSVHWQQNPDLKFPDYIKKVTVDEEDCFFTTSAYANYTNNPCLYNSSFIKKIMFNEIEEKLSPEQYQSANNYAKFKKTDVKNIVLELKLQNWWLKQNFRIMQGTGLFEHHPCKEKKDRKIHYDLVFSIGKGCSCSYHLRRMRLQQQSYPFDWIVNESDLELSMAFINHFEDYFLQNNLELAYTNSDGNNAYRDVKYNIVYVHDFDNKHIEEVYPKVKEKIYKRIKRLIERIKSSRKILMVYETPHKEYDLEDMKRCIGNMEQAFPGKFFSLLYIIHDSEFPSPETIYLSQQLTVIKFDNKGQDWTGNKENWDNILRKIKLSAKTKLFFKFSRIMHKYFDKYKN